MSTASSSTNTPVLDIHGAFVRRTNLSGASLRFANLAGADASGAIFVGADFYQTNLDGTILKGANLSEAKNLTIEQLNKAIVDKRTLLPKYIDRTRLNAIGVMRRKIEQPKGKAKASRRTRKATSK